MSNLSKLIKEFIFDVMTPFGVAHKSTRKAKYSFAKKSSKNLRKSFF